MDSLIIWLGFMGIFGTLLYGADKSMVKIKRNKYVKVNQFNKVYGKYIPVR